MIRVKGTLAALVSYCGPGKAKKVQDAVLYVAEYKLGVSNVVQVLVDENLLWVFNEDVPELAFLNALPKAVKVESILDTNKYTR